MKKLVGIVSLLLLLGAAALAAPNAAPAVPAFPKTLLNARYVYVTSYDGGQFNPHLLSEDRQAIADVQTALQNWGRYIVVYRPQEADMILAVQRRGSEDVLAAYDPHLGGDTYLWRVTGHGGLDRNELPLFSELRQAVNRAEK